jgi:hypothetical protein
VLFRSGIINAQDEEHAEDKRKRLEDDF